eukprot:NODE_111_length_18624_cov_1.285020.p1 type:complete len:600 gc:universal NODE_111_length_18624_cov_1.285020:14648-12849(-)
MKFGIHLGDSLHEPWKEYYIHYDMLKNKIKKMTLHLPISESDEADFINTLDSELQKMVEFQEGHYKRVIEDIGNTQITSDVKKLNKLSHEVHLLAQFTRLNYTALMKILKKHDKHTKYVLKQMYMIKLKSQPFHLQNYDKLIYQLSELYAKLNYKPEDLNKQQSKNIQFIRSTTKYWVHPENVMEVKLRILQHLPVLIFDRDAHNPAITSIYFDNKDMELYKGRIEKNENAQAVRLRWYGDMSQQEVFVERKTHKEDWTGETSVKERFPIKEKYVNDYLNGTYNYDLQLEKMKERGMKSNDELDKMKILADEVQKTVKEKQLRPVMRTFYNRTAFQLPNDANVRISLDTELTMVREDNFDNADRTGGNWRRMDIGIDHPFTQIETDVQLFQYAVLEVKLQTSVGHDVPEWVNQLINSHLVEAVPKFSKFIHGCATLLEKHVNLLPFWLPQMDKDILKPPMQLQPLYHRESLQTIQPPKQKDHSAVEMPSDESEDDESDIEIRPQPTWQQRIRRLFHKPSEVEPLLPREAFPSTHNQNKRIAVPVRVEPKVFFANERTFLSWLHFVTVLGGLSVGLLNFGDAVGRISGIIFTIVAMGICF